MELELANKKPDEKIITIIKQHWIYLVNILLFFAVMISLPIILYIVLGYMVGNLLDNQIIFAIATMLGTLYYLYVYAITYSSFLMYELDFWEVTNYRIVATRQRGLFNRTFAEHLIERIQDVSSVQKGFLATILNYGNIEIQTAGEEEKFIFLHVSNPEQKVGMINGLLSKKIQHKDSIVDNISQP